MQFRSKRVVSVLLALITVFMSVSVGLLTVQAFGSISYALNPDGKSYYVADCDDNYFGRAKISSTYEGLPVTKIYGKFLGDSSIETIIISEGIKEILIGFDYCRDIKNIYIPASVIYIKDMSPDKCKTIFVFICQHKRKRNGVHLYFVNITHLNAMDYRFCLDYILLSLFCQYKKGRKSALSSL